MILSAFTQVYIQSESKEEELPTSPSSSLDQPYRPLGTKLSCQGPTSKDNINDDTKEVRGSEGNNVKGEEKGKTNRPYNHHSNEMTLTTQGDKDPYFGPNTDGRQIKNKTRDKHLIPQKKG